MNNEFEGTQKIRQALEHSALSLDPAIVVRLAGARQYALSRQKASVTRLSLAGVGDVGGRDDAWLHRSRRWIAFAALTLGIVGTYYWNAFEQADENEEVDSALLADDLPIDAYTDHGFQAWLEHSSQSSPQ